MELKELHAQSLLGEEPVEPRLKDNSTVEIDMAWVAGLTCGDLFSGLTFEERWVLFLLYHEDKPEMSSSAFYRLMNKIKKKVKGSL